MVYSWLICSFIAASHPLAKLTLASASSTFGLFIVAFSTVAMSAAPCNSRANLDLEPLFVDNLWIICKENIYLLKSWYDSQDQTMIHGYSSIVQNSVVSLVIPLLCLNFPCLPELKIWRSMTSWFCLSAFKICNRIRGERKGGGEGWQGGEEQWWQSRIKKCFQEEQQQQHHQYLLHGIEYNFSLLRLGILELRESLALLLCHPLETRASKSVRKHPVHS